MPRFRQVNQIIGLMSEKERIRNLGIIAHIDHGKTTLADSLLAGAGFLSPKMAGTARVLDYLEEEQKRKITIKTSNISLPYKSYLINLVDTPGHVDFTGKVTRALRAVDGAIVVVDAVEEIMPQTEVVSQQALEERVRPVLFINKIDRLISELQLSEKQIEKKLQHIIDTFNDLVDLYGDEAFREEWKVHPQKGNIAFGSALHGWGFTLGVANAKNLKFSDIILSYKNKRQEELREKIPIYDAIFEMVIEKAPNPLEAQEYRMEKIWDGHVESEIGRALTACKDDGPTVICVTNVKNDAEAGVIAAGRIFSGTVRTGDRLYLLEGQTETAVNHVYVQMGSFREEVKQVSAGNIVTLAVSSAIKAGETLVDISHKDEVVPFENMKIVEPVMTMAVEPKDPKKLPVLINALKELVVEDPNHTVFFNKETGEYVLNGMGELHLEIAMKHLNNSVQLVSSPPRVVYRESVIKKGIEAMAKSPNKQNQFTLQVEPLTEDTVGDENSIRAQETEDLLSVDEFRNVLVDRAEVTKSVEEPILELIIAGFEFACSAGPLCGEPVKNVKVNLLSFQLGRNQDLQSSVEITHGISKAIFGSFLTAKPILLEPVYKTVISVPIELSGECQRIMTSRRGKISSFEQKGLLAIISGFVPVAESFGLSQELRSTTSGRAFWQSILDCWEQMPEKLAANIIAEIRTRKGLPIEIPNAGRFLEEK